MIMRLVTIAALLLFSLHPLHKVQAQENRHLTSAELRHILQTEDTRSIVQALNRAKRNQDSSELMSFLLKLWAGDGRSSELPWAVIEAPRLRIEIANVLIQASNNGFITFNHQEAREYSLQVAAGRQSEAWVTAILNIGLIADPRDIEMLKKIALKEDRHTFRAAVISLARMCDPAAERALDEVRARVRGNESKEFARIPSNELIPFKQCPPGGKR